MCASVSPHDSTTQNEPGFVHQLMHQTWNLISYPFITDGELKWATGILSVNDDFETCKNPKGSPVRALLEYYIRYLPFFLVHNASACAICTLPYVSAKMVTDINDGFNVCSIPQDQISRVRVSSSLRSYLKSDILQFTESQCGCTFKDLGVCLNLVYVFLCPCTLCWWRSKLRKIRKLEVLFWEHKLSCSRTLTNTSHTQGSCFGDHFSTLCCCPCSICQQTREIKLRGVQ
jgi:hypothetical protein